MLRKEKEKKKAEAEKKKSKVDQKKGASGKSRTQPGRKAKEAKSPVKTAKKMANGVSKANAKSTKPATAKKLQAAKERLLKKTGDSEAVRKGKDRMRRIAQEPETEDDMEVVEKKSSRKSSGRAKASQEVSWKEPITDYYSSVEEDEEMGEEEEEEEEEEGSLNTTLIESPEDTDSDVEVEVVKRGRKELSSESSSDEETIRRKPVKSRQQRSKSDLPLSELVPKALWPRGMSKEAIDALSLPMLKHLQEHDLALRKLDGEAESKNPGKVVDETTTTMTSVLVPAQKHDFMKKFSAGQFLHFPLSPPETWWKYVAVAYEEVTPEFGAEERGVTGKIARSTWISAHNRKWIGQLPFWSSQNVYENKLKNQSVMKVVRGGVRITTNESDAFTEIKSVQEAWTALNNYRSAWNRLWPWDWTPVSAVVSVEM